MISFSPRERQIVKMLYAGETGVAIGKALGISPKTVSEHVTRARHKVGARTQQQLVGIAVDLGLIGRRIQRRKEERETWDGLVAFGGL